MATSRRRREDADEQMRVKRQRHRAVLKGRVGLEAQEGVKTVVEIAPECQVHSKRVSQWKRPVADPGLLWSSATIR